jgi:hypothetical protein
MNNLGNYIQLLVLLLVFAASAIGWVWRKYQEQREIQRIERDRERRRMEGYRTGKFDTDVAPTTFGVDTQQPKPTMQAPGSPTIPAGGTAAPTAEDVKRRLAELAERRRAELEALRKRGQSGAPAPAAPAAPAPTRVPVQPAQQPVQPVAQPRPQPRQQPQPVAPSRPAQQRRTLSPQQAEAERRKRAAAQARAEDEERRRREQERSDQEAHEAREAAFRRVAQAGETEAVPAKPAVATVGGALAGLGPVDSAEQAAQWRRAILMMEVLSPPVSAREDGARVL